MRFTTLAASLAAATSVTITPSADKFLCLFSKTEDCKSASVKSLGDCRPIEDELKIEDDKVTFLTGKVTVDCEKKTTVEVNDEVKKIITKGAEEWEKAKKEGEIPKEELGPKPTEKRFKNYFGPNYAKVIAGTEVCELEGAAETEFCGGDKEVPKASVKLPDSAPMVGALGVAVVLAAMSLRM